MKLVPVLLLFVAAALAGARIGGVTHPAFQAAAHLFVGGLIAAGLCRGWRTGRGFHALAAALSAVEVLVFFRVI